MMKKLTIAAAALAAVIPFSSAQADMKKIGDHSYHYFEDYYSSLVVVGNKGVLIVDPANSLRAMKLKSEVAKITDQPITHVVLSHEHFDHIGGTEVFKNADIICQVSCQKVFGLDPLGLAPEKVTMPYLDKLSIDLGGVTTQVHYLGVADGVATSVTYVPTDGVVSTADIYDPHALTNGAYLDDSNMLGKRKVLNQISQWDIKHSLSGHSPITSVDALKEGVNYYNDLYDAVKLALDPIIAKGGLFSAYQRLGDDLPMTIKVPAYQHMKGYQEHLPKHIWRMGMSIAHGG